MTAWEQSRAELDRWNAVARDWTARHREGIRLAVIVVATAWVAYVGWFMYDAFSGLPGTEELRSLSDDTAQTTTIYDAHDRPIFSIPTEHQIEIPLEQISPHLVSAILAVEDQRFYAHKGIDHLRIVGAAFANLRSGRPVQGGSTITQQLARNSFLTRDKTLRRKLREAILAERLEHLYSKDDILALYLNRVYFGNGLYGAEAAARGFFGKSAAELTLGEAAMLAGLVRAPSTTNPVASPEKAVARRNVVLDVLKESGGDADTIEHARNEPVTLRDTLHRDDPIGLYFKEQVRRQVIEQFGEASVLAGRLRVYTTMDPAMQQAAEDAVSASLRELDVQTRRSSFDVRRSSRRTKNEPPRTPNAERQDQLQAALVALDPQTGEVRAIVGGRDATNLGLNRAVQARRQPGSAFKPFVYAAALERGFTPATLIEQLDKPIPTLEGAWNPEDEHSTAPAMTIRTALRTSSNRAAVHMLEEVGIDDTISYAQRLGIGEVPHAPSVALGSGEVSLLEMTSAYGAFAHAGVTQPPIFIRRVEDRDGNVLFRATAQPRQAVSETTAFLMANMMADVLDMGTAAAARTMGFTRPAAGKTGTTNDFVDAWFVGFTPLVVAGVWVGYDQPRTIMPNGFAGRVAVPLWTRFMKEATKNDPKIGFNPPPGVEAIDVCRLSGLLPAPGCRDAISLTDTGEVVRRPMVYTEYFAAGTEPKQTCPIHAYTYVEPPLVGTSGLADFTFTTTAPQAYPRVAPPPPPPPPPTYAEPPITPVRVPTVAPAPPPPQPAPNEPPAAPVTPDSLPVPPPGR